MAKYDAMIAFEENVTRILADRGWTKQDLADQLGMDRSTLSKIIRGVTAATTTTLVRIADGLGVQLWELFAPSDKFEKVAG